MLQNEVRLGPPADTILERDSAPFWASFRTPEAPEPSQNRFRRAAEGSIEWQAILEAILAQKPRPVQPRPCPSGPRPGGMRKPARDSDRLTGGPSCKGLGQAGIQVGSCLPKTPRPPASSRGRRNRFAHSAWPSRFVVAKCMRVRMYVRHVM